MKRLLSRSLALLCALAMLLAIVPMSFAADSAEFAIYSTTDIHGKCWDKNVLADTNENNNMLRVATAMKKERATYGENVVLVDNGDLYQGTPVSAYQLNQMAAGKNDWPAAMALCLNEIGYDFAGLGNHEFNYGWDTMTSVRSYLADNGIPSVCANLYYDGSDGVHAKDENVLTPYITKTLTVGGRSVKIGILGLVTPDCTRWDIPENYPGIVFAHSDNPNKDMAIETARYLPQMQAEGCDLIVVAFHSGLGAADGELTFSVNTENQVARVIAKNEGIAMVIAGHDHSTGYTNNYYKDKNGEDVLVVNGGGTQLTKTVFTVTDDAISIKSSENLVLSNYASDADLLAKIKPYAELANEYVNAVAGTAVGTWDSETNYYLKQSDTMDLIQTAQMYEGSKHMAEKYDTEEKRAALYAATGLDHIDVDMSSTSVVVNGSYHVSAGEMTMKNIYKMYRYDNNLYLLALTGQQIKDIMEQNAETRLKAFAGGGTVTYSTIGENFTNPVFGGLNFEYDMYQPVGERVVIHGFANGRDFDLEKVYIVGVNNYHLGNAGCGFGNYSTADSIWSQTDDMGGGVVQDLIMEFFQDMGDKGVDPDEHFNWTWALTYSGDPNVSLDLVGDIVAKKVNELVDGQKILIYYSAEGTVVNGALIEGASKAAGMEASASGNYIATDAASAVYTVEAAGEHFALKNTEGKYLTSAESGNGLSFADELTECGKWYLKAVDGGVHIMNVGAHYGDSYNQALENYSGFTTYGESDSSAYLFNVYAVVNALSKVDTLENDHKYVIFYEGDGDSCIGSDFMKAPVTAEGGKLILPLADNTLIVTAKVDGEQVAFVTEDGKYLTSGATGGSLSLTDDQGDLSRWLIVKANGGYNIKSVGAAYNGNHNQAIEYYSGKFTTYGLQASAIYLYNFYEIKNECAHEHTEDIAVPPTCLDPGYIKTVCLDCGADLKGTDVPALGHDWDEGTVTTEPTCTSEGEKCYSCSRCPATKTETLSKIPHDYTETVVEPTCTEKGYTLYTCSGCGDSYKKNYTAALGHDYADGVCTNCGEADPSYKPFDPTEEFVDIPSNAWYIDAVRFAVENGLMNGMGKGEFQPEESTTRAMVVTILYRLSGSTEKYEHPFTDVLDNVWYTDAVAWAYHNGIVNGMTETTFEPDTKMSREMLAVILYRYTKTVAPDKLDASDDLSAFPDNETVSFWAREAVQWAVANGILNGNKNAAETYLEPLANATRAQVAAIFQRYIVNILN